MANSLIVVRDCSASSGSYPVTAFHTGDIVADVSPYYYPLLWSGNATDSGQPSPTPDPILIPSVVVLPGGKAGLPDELAGYLADNDNHFQEALNAAIEADIFASPGGVIPATKQAPQPAGYGWRQIERDSGHGALTFGPDGAIWSNELFSAGGRSLAYSTDGMQTWTEVPGPDPAYSANLMWFSVAGTMFVECAGKVYRSTDGGTTFAEVLDVGQPNIHICGEGWIEDPTAPGHLYIGSYGNGNVAGVMPNGEVIVYESTDDGVTWATHSSFPAMGDNPTSPGAIRHIHVLTFLFGNLWCCTGDDTNDYSSGPGIWKWSGTEWTRMAPEQVPDSAPWPNQRWRTTWLEGRTDDDGQQWLYWARDSGGATQGEVGKAPANDLASYVQIAPLPTGSFYHGVLSDGTILFGGSAEDGGGVYGEVIADQYLRLWALDIKDQVHEVWRGQRNDAALNSGNYGQFSTGINVDANDNVLVGPINMDWQGSPTGSYARESMLGRVEHGVPPVSLVTVKQPSQHLIAQRAWETTATTQAPTTTGTSNLGTAIMPDMSLTIPTVPGGTYLVTLTAGVVSGNTSPCTIFCGIGLEGQQADQDTTQTVRSDDNADYQTITLTKVWTPSNPGPRIVSGLWWVGASGYGKCVNKQRKLTVLELSV